jgi:hypothetical protein
MIVSVIDTQTYSVRLVNRETGEVLAQPLFSLPAAAFRPVLLKDVALPTDDGDGDGDDDGDDDNSDCDGDGGSGGGGRGGGGGDDTGGGKPADSTRRVAELRPKRPLVRVAAAAAEAAETTAKAGAVESPEGP